MNQHITAVTNQTKAWLNESVIHYQLCPYAKQPHEDNNISYHVYTENEVLPLLEQLALCCLCLDEKTAQTLETTLLIIADENQNYLSDFYDYLDVLDVANEFLEKPQVFITHFSPAFQSKYADRIPTSWANTYQLASFHPDYQFEETNAEDRENYTNRSPYPILHIIRNDSIEHARMNDKQADKIVQRNINTLNSLSKDAFQQLQKLAKPNK